MKKVFPLEVAGRKPALVLDAIKNDLRKYLKRERKKALPEGVDFWDFDCKVGPSSADAVVTHPGDIEKGVAEAAAKGEKEVYVEILAKPGHRAKKGE